MTETNVAEIARGLTKAQRELLANDYGDCVDSYPPARKLIALDLANSRYTAMGAHRLIWTPLGLAIRNHLTGDAE